MRLKLLPFALLASPFFLLMDSAAANPTSWTIDQDHLSVFEVARPKPAGATRQWMRFWFNSHGLFGTSRHVAVALRGNLGRDANGQIMGSAVTGRGIIIGHTNGVEPETDPFAYSQLYNFPERTHGGCLNWWLDAAGPRPGQSQVEIFLPSSNRLYQSSCVPQIPLLNTPSLEYVPDRSKGLQDDQWYRYTIEVSNAGQVRFEIQDTAGNILANSVVEDGWNFAAVDGLSQWIGVSDGTGISQSICSSPYCDAPMYEPFWSVHFTQIEGGWN